ncbi:MAG: peptidoglycan-binding protein LysM, partial [Castellaniella sp.]
SSTANSGAGAAASSAGSPSAAAGADSAAQAAEPQPSERTQHRVSWLQDHLLGVMTGLLALIVLIIAWLLRRANAARDEADASPRVTEAMVRERIQDVDLNLEPGESRPPQQH